MKRLSKGSFSRAYQNILDYGRPLEISLAEACFSDGTQEAIIQELKKFQNHDGGFGQGIESDFRLPLSSPLATSVGVRILNNLEKTDESLSMIKAAIGYFESTFNQERMGWFAVPREVNDYPHAPWWHYDEDKGMTVIDKSWGNPTAEILAYLYQYQDYLQKLNILELVEYAIQYMEAKEDFTSEHEIYCFIKLYEMLPEELQHRLEKIIRIAVEALTVYDHRQWQEYVPRPIDFLHSTISNSFGVLEEGIQMNVNYIINELEEKGKILPPWGQSFYQGDLKPAYNEWIGELTYKALKILDSFNRIENFD